MNCSLKNNDQGFSLVELIVTVLITGIMMLTVSLFLSTSRNAYQTVNTSAVLQEEAITTERVISEFLMEAKEYNIELKTINGAACKVIWIRARENEGSNTSADPVYFLVYDSNAKQLKYCKGTYSLINESTGKMSEVAGSNAVSYIESKCFGPMGKFSLISEHVEGMEIPFSEPISRPDGTNMVCLKFKYSYAGKEYEQTLTVGTRNMVTTKYGDS